MPFIVMLCFTMLDNVKKNPFTCRLPDYHKIKLVVFWSHFRSLIQEWSVSKFVNASTYIILLHLLELKGKNLRILNFCFKSSIHVFSASLNVILENMAVYTYIYWLIDWWIIEHTLHMHAINSSTVMSQTIVYDLFFTILADWTGQVHFWCGLHAVWGIYFCRPGDVAFSTFCVFLPVSCMLL